MSKDINIEIHIDVNNLTILSVNENDEVILKSGIVDYCKDDKEDCIVYIKRSLFLAMINDWLNHKQGYYTRGCGFAGEGYISLENIMEYPEDRRSYLNVFHGESDNEDEWYTEQKYVRTFSALSFSIDMEHG